MRRETKIKIMGGIAIGLCGLGALSLGLMEFRVWCLGSPPAFVLGWRFGKWWGRRG